MIPRLTPGLRLHGVLRTSMRPALFCCHPETPIKATFVRKLATRRKTATAKDPATATTKPQTTRKTTTSRTRAAGTSTKSPSLVPETPTDIDPIPPDHTLSQSPTEPLWFLLADVHISDRTIPRLEKFFDYFFTEFNTQKPTQVIFLGDIFHVRGGTDPTHHRVFTDLLERILQAPWHPKVHLLVGNHDMKNRYNRQDNSLHPFSLSSGKVYVYSENKSVVLDGHPVTFIPFHADDVIVRDFVKTDVTPDKIAFYHGPVLGAIMNTKQICYEAGVIPDNLAGYKRTFLGHFHTHGPVGDPESSVLYVGAPIQSNMGDANDLNKGFVSYRPDQNEWILHRNPYAEYFVKIPWSGMDSVTPEMVAGKKVQVRMAKGPEVEQSQIEEARERLFDMGADMVEVRYKARDVKKVSTAQLASEEITAVSLQDTIPDMVNGFMGVRKGDQPWGINLDLEEKRREFFLEFIKPYQQNAPRVENTGKVFQGDLASITMHNFRGVRDTCKFDLDALPGSDVFLVAGANGSGKSTLIEAVVWCLFGEFVGKRIPADEIAYKDATDCYVRLDFRNGYSFIRQRKGRKTKKLTFTIIDPLGQTEEHGHDATSTTKYLIENILHMDISMFKQTVVIGDNAEYFVRAAGEQERTQTLDMMFGLDFLGQIREELGFMIKDLERQIFQLENTERGLKNQIHENGYHRHTRATEASDEEIKVKALNKELDELKSRLDPLRAKLKIHESEIKQYREALNDVEMKREPISKIINTLSERQQTYRMVERQHENLRAERDRQLEIERELMMQEQERRQKEYEHSLTLQGMFWSFFNQAVESLRDYFGIIPDPIPEPPKEKPAHIDLTKIYDPILQEYNRLKVNALTNNISYHQKRLSDQMREQRIAAEALRAPKYEHRRLENIINTSNHRRSQIEGQLSYISSQRNQRARHISELESRAKQLSASLETNSATLLARNQKLSLAGFWQLQLQDAATKKGAFITHCRSSYVSHINTLIPPILSSLCDDAEGLLSTQQLLLFQLTPDFQLRPVDGALSLAKRSRGQLTRTYLALFLGMFIVARARMQFRPNFLWMDEVIDALDVTGIEGLQTWLREYCGAIGARAFLLTHREVSGARVIRVEKDMAGRTQYKLVK